MAVAVTYVQAGGYTAAQDRMGRTAGLFKSARATARAGIIPSDTNDLDVFQQATASMGVDVATGQAVIPDAVGGAYVFTSDSIASPIHDASDPTNPRIDLVIARVYDNEAGDAAATSNLTLPGTAGTTPVQQFTGKVEIVKGTPGASPATPALPSTRCIVLKKVTVRAAATSVLTSDLSNTGRAQWTTGLGGTLLCTSTTRPPASPGTVIFESDTGLLQAAIGGAWAAVRPGGPLGKIAVNKAHGAQDITALVTIMTLSATLIAGRTYQVVAYAMGNQITNASATTYASLDDGAAGLLASKRLFSGPAGATQALAAGATFTYQPVSTGSVTFSLKGLATAAAFRVVANTCEIAIYDAGT